MWNERKREGLEHILVPRAFLLFLLSNGICHSHRWLVIFWLCCPIAAKAAAAYIAASSTASVAAVRVIIMAQHLPH